MVKIKVSQLRQMVRSTLLEANAPQKQWYEKFYCPLHKIALKPIFKRFNSNFVVTASKTVARAEPELQFDAEKMAKYKNIIPPTTVDPNITKRKEVISKNVSGQEAPKTRRLEMLVCPMTEKPGEYEVGDNFRACDYHVTVRKQFQNQLSTNVALGRVAEEFDVNGRPAPVREEFPKSFSDAIESMIRKKKEAGQQEGSMTFTSNDLKILTWEYPNKLSTAKKAAEAKGETYKGPEPYYVKSDVAFRELRKRGLELADPIQKGERRTTPASMPPDDDVNLNTGLTDDDDDLDDLDLSLDDEDDNDVTKWTS